MDKNEIRLMVQQAKNGGSRALNSLLETNRDRVSSSSWFVKFITKPVYWAERHRMTPKAISSRKAEITETDDGPDDSFIIPGEEVR